MKKYLIFLIGIVSFLGINTVKAEEKYFEYDTNINTVSSIISDIGYDLFKEYVNNTINYYKINYTITHPYYVISFIKHSSADYFYIFLTATNNLIDPNPSTFNNYEINSYVFTSLFDNVIQLGYTYNIADKTFSDFVISTGSYSNISIFEMNADYNYFTPYNYYYSNFDLYYYGSYLSEYPFNLDYLSFDDEFYIPTFEKSSFYSVHKANSDFLIEPYYLYDNNSNLELEDNNYVEIDLNKYEYIALSLKDYSKTEKFYTNVYVKGNYCLTPVYDYGMKEKSEYYSSYQVDRCSPYYDNYTLVRTYILEQDLKNNAIYYLKSYDKTKDNLVKIDTSIFNITYITAENKDNPYVSVNGKDYPTISYDKLTSSSTKSEDEGYISGESCAIGDFNCYEEYDPNNIFENLFTSPLEILKSVWSAIASIFAIITEFILLLPSTMQGFLYVAFGIGIILGIIKILL